MKSFAKGALLAVMAGTTLGGAAARAEAPRVTPLYGNISAFYGNISPFYGNISPFYGNISPFWGNISPFWGNISPFWGNISAFWGNISPFGTPQPPAGMISPQWGNISAFWQDTGNQWAALSGQLNGLGDRPTRADLDPIAGQMQQIVDGSAAFWAGAVREKTGKSFEEGFARPILARYGIDPKDGASLAALDPGRRAQFFLEWYDGLMNLSGTDRVDHWMKTANWNPALTQIQGAGSDSVIGLLDFTVADAGLQDSVTAYKGTSSFANGHGSAVASLMIAPQDGEGVMGIAPRAAVLAYNPFDSSGTASWDDVGRGVRKLMESKASVVNASLGVAGYTLHPDWNKTFGTLGKLLQTNPTIFVIAAGNDGITQTVNVPWSAANPQIIVVGSVDPNEQISSFSNRPGEACLTGLLGLCASGSELKNRFIVAPGELILVQDDKGSTVRMSGTSFAAPMVSATIALLHDRWPWLARYPKTSTDIVLKSAKDLGAPGVDPVYGVGLLDIAASQSPLNFSALKWYTRDKAGNLKPQSTGAFVADSKTMGKWEADGVAFYAFEDYGETYRDFAIPLSTRLVGQMTATQAGKQQRFQEFLTSRFIDWVAAGKTGKGFTAFTSTAPVYNPYGLNMTMSVAPRVRRFGYRQDGVPFQTALTFASAEGTTAFSMGSGDGAVALGGAGGFGLASDYEGGGGANPLLGFASGGAYAGARTLLAKGVTLSFGATRRNPRRDLRDLPLDQVMRLGRLRDNTTAAQTMSVAWAIDPAVSVSAGYTHLDERSALLGTQSLDRADLAGGAQTDGATIGTEVALPGGFGFAAAGTLARTRTANVQAITAGRGGILTSSYEVALTKTALFGGRDRARLTLSQPMYLERGAIEFTGMEVIDRQTGELGAVTHRLDVSGRSRPFVAEALYARPLIGGAAEASLFGRARLTPGVNPDGLPTLIGGARLRLVL
ncbi:MAG: S8 family serine peptidase [Sphingomonas fennica]